MDICRRVPYVGAIHGSASVMTIIRSFQYYLNQEAFKDWKPWRRMFFISAWGWHDIRQAKFVKSEEENDKKLKSELKRLAIWFSVMMAGVLFNKLIWGGNAYAHLTAKEAFQKFFVERDADMWKFFAVRWGVGYWTLLAWFYAMDSFPRSLHFWATQHELKMISDVSYARRFCCENGSTHHSSPSKHENKLGCFFCNYVERILGKAMECSSSRYFSRGKKQ